MTYSRFKSWLTFWQFVLGTVVLGVFSTVISNQIQTREVEIKEQEGNAQFLEQALQEDVGIRRRLAQYFSHVTRSNDLRDRWADYAKIVEQEYQATLDEKKKLQEQAEQVKDPNDPSRGLLLARISQLEQELSPKQSTTTSLAARVYMHIEQEERRSEANKLADSLRDVAIAVPGVQRTSERLSKTELRYFRPNEQVEAEGITARIRTSLPDVELRFVPGFQNSTGIRPRHYELWIATPVPVSQRRSP